MYEYELMDGLTNKAAKLTENGRMKDCVVMCRFRLKDYYIDEIHVEKHFFVD